MIELRQISKVYRLGQVLITAIHNIDMVIRTGEFLAIAGASGSGKSTLLNITGGIERPNSGQVVIEGADLGRLTSDQLADFRARSLGFVFQTFNLLPVLTVYENVEYPLIIRGTIPTERRKRVLAVLQEVGLADHRQHRPSQLSGGQRQRVAVARALVGGPSLVLADEPTANLDHQTGIDILDLMRNLNKKLGVTLVMATHDPKIMQRADRVVELEDGRILRSS